MDKATSDGLGSCLGGLGAVIGILFIFPRMEGCLNTKPQEQEDEVSEPVSTVTVPSSSFISPSGHIFNGVRLYHGPNKNYVDTILGADDEPRVILIRNASDEYEWKDWNMVILGNEYGQWYIRSDDPNIKSSQLTKYEFQE